MRKQCHLYSYVRVPEKTAPASTFFIFQLNQKPFFFFFDHCDCTNTVNYCLIIAPYTLQYKITPNGTPNLMVEKHPAFTVNFTNPTNMSYTHSSPRTALRQVPRGPIDLDFGKKSDRMSSSSPLSTIDGHGTPKTSHHCDPS